MTARQLGDMHHALSKLAGSLCQYLEGILPLISANYWSDLVLPALYDPAGKTSLRDLDLPCLLRVFDRHFRLISGLSKLPPETRSWMHEIKVVRNRWAHLAPGVEIPPEDFARDLDTARRLARAVGENDGRSNKPSAGPRRQVTKSYAIARLNREYGNQNLNNHNTTFANINSTTNVWWMEIAYSVFEPQGAPNHNILLYDRRTGELHHMLVPTEDLRKNKGRFVSRNERKRVGLQLATDSARKFKNIVPIWSDVDFGKYWKRSVIVSEPERR